MKTSFYLLLFAFLFFQTPALFGQTYETAQSGDWDNDATWVGDAPGYSFDDDVTINISGDHEVMIPEGEDLVFGDNCTINVNGELTVNGDINPHVFFSINISGNGIFEINGSVDEAHDNFTLTLDDQGSFILNDGFIKGQSDFTITLNDESSFTTNNGNVVNHSDINFTISPNANAQIDGNIELHQNADLIIDGELYADAIDGHEDGDNAATGNGTIICPDIVGVDTSEFDGDINSSSLVTIDGSFSVSDKTYDGTTSAQISNNNLTLAGVDENDDVQLTNVEAAFSDANVASDISVMIISAELTGSDAGDYYLDDSGAPETKASITKATLQVTASSHEITYGDGVPDLSVNYSGFVGEDDETDLDNTDFQLSTTYQRYENAGNYGVSLQMGDASDNNYSFDLTDGDINVLKKDLHITASAQDIIYGDPSPEVTLQFDGFVGNDDESDLADLSFDTGTTYEQGNNTGDYETTIAVNGDDTNYSVTTETSEFTVQKKELNATAIADDVTYGDAPPSVSLEYEGFVNNDDASVLDDTGFALGTNYEAGDSPGTYSTTIETGSAEDNNYQFNNLQTTNFDVNKKTLQVTAIAEDITFGNEPPEVTLVYDGFIQGEDETNLNNTNFDTGTNYNQYDPAGTYETSLSSGNAYDPNYEFSLNTSEFNVDEATLTVTAIVQPSVRYGDPEPEVTVEYEGFINGDGEENLDNTDFDLGTDYTQGDDAGTYSTSISTGSAEDNNYQFDLKTSEFTAAKKDLEVTALANNITYNDPAPTVDIDFEGFYGSDDSGNLDNTDFDLGTDYSRGDDAGTYNTTIELGSATDNNYNFMLNSSTFEVEKKELEVIANASDITYGDSSPSVSITYNGFVNNDDASDLENTGFETGTNYNQYDPTGTYETTISKSSANDQNYTFTPLTTTNFTVDEKNLDISATSFSKTEGVDYTFDDTYPSNNFSVSGLVSDDEVESLSIESDGAQASAAVGDYPVNISNASGTGLSNYNIAYSEGTLTVVEKTTLEIDNLDVADKTYDGTTDGEVSSWGSLTGVESGDDVELDHSSAVVEFTSKDADNNINVDISELTLSGDDAVKYELNTPTPTATISPKDLTLSAFKAENKTYDGTTTASGITFNDDRLNDDLLSFDFDARFEDKNAGTNKTVNITDITISGGEDAGNYNLATTSGTASAGIEPKDLSLNDFSANDKVYDGTTVADGITFTDNRVDSDDLEFSFDAQFEDRHAGTDKTVNIEAEFSGGDDKDNYNLISSTGETKATISPKEIGIDGNFSVEDKEYERNKQANIETNNLTLDAIEADDNVSLENVEAEFTTRQAGENKTVTISNADISGGHAANYSLTLDEAPEATANITPKTISISGSFSAQNKSYDETTDAQFNENDLGLSGREIGDDVSIDYADIEFESPDPGHNKTVTITNTGLTGEDAGNYIVSLSGAPTDTAHIWELPDAKDDARATEYETPLDIDVLANDQGLENTPLTVDINSTETGTAKVNGDNTITYTPENSFSGETSFEYKVTDNGGNTDIATVDITVLEEGVSNHIPEANNDYIETQQNTSVNIPVLANDKGLEDGFGNLEVISGPDDGTIAVNSDRTITYTPDVDYEGSDNFVYRVSDKHGDNDEATVTIDVSSELTAEPVANHDSVATEYETPVTVNILENDTGLDNGPLTVDITTQPSSGTVEINQNNSVTFKPADAFSGEETFEYSVTDDNGASDKAEVSVTVLEEGLTNHVPAANDDEAATSMNLPVNISILTNDAGLEDGFGSIEIISGPDNGEVEINKNRTLTYTPGNWFVGNDTFVYRLSDVHGDNDIATVSVSVTDPDDETPESPVAKDDSCATEYETPVSVDVLENDTGLNNTPLTVDITTQPSSGSVDVDQDNSVTYTPEDEFYGEETFEYTVSDSNGNSDNATVTITVLEDGITNNVPVANNDNATTPMNTPSDINVLANDAGMEDGFGSMEIISGPENGSAEINSNHTIRYTPDDWYVGDDQFVYRLTDIHGDNDIATVSVSVTDPGDEPAETPEAKDDSLATEFETPVNIDVLANDTGLANTPLNVTISSHPENGSAEVNDNNTVTFTPDEAFNGEETFEYTITDDNGASDNAVVSIKVLEEGVVNHVPVANDDEVSTNMNTPVDIQVLANDENLDDGPGNVEVISGPEFGNISINEDKTITYSPSYMFVGDDSFDYRVSDIHGDNDIATVDISVVDPASITPEANPLALATEYETPVTIDVLRNDTGLVNGPVTVTINTPPDAEQATTMVNSDNTVTYTPADGFDGQSSFEYTVTDANDASDNATVTVTVLEEGTQNHIPEAMDDEATTYINTPVRIDVLSNDAGLEDGFGNMAIMNQPEAGKAVVNDDNTITFTPSYFQTGTTTFTYRLADVHGDYDQATVKVTILDEENIIPEAIDDEASTTENTPVNIDVLANDNGLDDVPISVEVSRQPENGTTTVENDNTITYSPDQDFAGQESFRYTVTDANGDNNEATVTLKVEEDEQGDDGDDEDDGDDGDDDGSDGDNGDDGDDGSEEDDGTDSGDDDSDDGDGEDDGNDSGDDDSDDESDSDDDETDPDEDNDGDDSDDQEANQIPEAHNDNVSTLENTSVNIDILDNDQKLDDEPVSISINENSQNGNVEIKDDNSVTFTPDDGFTGETSFTYRVADVDDDFDEARVEITVIERIDAINDTLNIDINTSGEIDLLANDKGINNKSIDVAVIDNPRNGSISIDNDGKAVYDPFNDYSGEDVITFEICNIDNNNDCSQATLTIRINDREEETEGIWIPEGFSPDGDGINDYFEIKGIAKYSRVVLRIYNRWGSLIFKSEDYQNNWDGRSSKTLGSSNKVSSGTYFYYIKIVDNGKEYKGNVYLKK